MKAPSKRKSTKAMLLGLGLDNKDNHKRVTRGENFLLLDGSQETHERMTEKAIKFNEKLKQRGMVLEQVTKDEFLDIAHEIDM